MAGEFDGIVDSLSRQGEVPSTRLRSGQATTATGLSPAVEARPDYHTDVPVDRRPAFAKSAADDGGLSYLISPNERGPSTQQVLLASDQSDVKGVMTMKPRSVEVHRGEGPAKRGSGAIMSSEDIGLSLRPITIQRQADVDKHGTPLNPEAFQPEIFPSDGTSAGHQRLQRDAVQEQPQPRAEAAAAPAQRLQPVAASVPARQVKPKQRVIFMPPGGGKIRINVDSVIIGNGVLILMYDANADTSYEPPKADSTSPIGIQVGDKQFNCIYSNWSAEQDGVLYLVLIMVAGSPSS